MNIKRRRLLQGPRYYETKTRERAKGLREELPSSSSKEAGGVKRWKEPKNPKAKWNLS